MQAPSIEELRVGDSPAWSWFVSEYGSPVSHYARRLGHPDPDEVSGATMETIVRRINHFEGGQPELRSFVFSVAHARIVDELRSTYRKREVTVPEVPETDDHSGDVVSISFCPEMEAALGQLSRKQQHLIRLRYVEGMSTREVAQSVGETEGATRVNLSRGLHKLRDVLPHR
jgi:RNA polymerase sigma factor (sigma-70 family)